MALGWMAVLQHIIRWLTIQIWFQNKRQNDRRRSRPLGSAASPDGMSDSSLMSDPPSECGSSASENNNISPEQQQHEPQQQDEGPATEDVQTAVAIGNIPSTIAIGPDASSTVLCDSQSTVVSATVPPSEAMPSIEAPTQETAPTEPSNTQTAPFPSQDRAEKGELRDSWISNRRSASFKASEENDEEPVEVPPSAQPVSSTQPVEEELPPRKLRPSNSFVRLSMADGNARVITDADKTPSPPQAKSDPATHAKAATGLSRSYSAASLNDRFAAAASGEPPSKIRRTHSTIGHSRNSRTWEFWCDADARNSTSLTARAHQEETGDAADAIGLLRASRRVLERNQRLQNTPTLSRGESARTPGSSIAKKSRKPLQRASTTHGRLQSKSSKKSGGGQFEDLLAQPESDKENWEPDMPKSSRQRQQKAPRRGRRVLQENLDIMSQSNSLGAMMARERGKVFDDPEQDDELREFMSGDVNSAEEVAGVEGLLKLSQGNWR